MRARKRTNREIVEWSEWRERKRSFRRVSAIAVMICRCRLALNREQSPFFSIIWASETGQQQYTNMYYLYRISTFTPSLISTSFIYCIPNESNCFGECLHISIIHTENVIEFKIHAACTLTHTQLSISIGRRTILMPCAPSHRNSCCIYRRPISSGGEITVNVELFRQS